MRAVQRADRKTTNKKIWQLLSIATYKPKIKKMDIHALLYSGENRAVAGGARPLLKNPAISYI